MSARTLAAAIEATAGDERVECCVVGEGGYDDESRWDLPRNRLLPWAAARAGLDHRWDTGFGGVDCPPVFAWSKSRLVVVHEYDGATGVDWYPRDPTTCKASFTGVEP